MFVKIIGFEMVFAFVTKNHQLAKKYRETNEEKVKAYREANKEKTKTYHEANRERSAATYTCVCVVLVVALTARQGMG